jgi:kynureninase
MQTLTVPHARDRFPTLANATYLVSHSMGAPPLAARDALRRYWEQWAENGPEAWDGWLSELAEIADGLGRMLGAPAGSVSLVPNVSLAQAAIASALDLRGSRCEIAIEALQFPSVTYVWKAWERFGARVREIPSDDGRTTSTERICEAIGEGTAAVVLSHAAYLSGAVIDAAAVAERCRATGTLFVLDVYQTAGVYPFDLGELGVDVAVGGSHKWLCGGPGCGFIYVRPELREGIAPAVTGWMGHEAPFAFEPAPIRLAAGSRRYNTGTPPVPGFIVARAGHDAVRAAGAATARAHNIRLTTQLAEGALARGFEVVTPLEPERRTGWIGMDFPGAERAVPALVERRVFVDYRPGCGLRAGPHFYSSADDIAAFFEALDEVRLRG